MKIIQKFFQELYSELEDYFNKYNTLFTKASYTFYESRLIHDQHNSYFLERIRENPIQVAWLSFSPSYWIDVSI